MPLARIRTESRELALDLAEELYELGYTVETIAPAEYRESAADLEIQLEACDPNQLTSLVARVGENYKRVFLAEGVIDRLPLPPVSVPERPPIAQQPIAFVEVADPSEVPPPVTIGPPVESVQPPPAMEPVLATANNDPYAQHATGRTRRVAELVASLGTALSRAGLFVSDKADDFRERLSALRFEIERRRHARAERLQVQRQRATDLAAAEALKREAEREARRAAKPVVQPAPVASVPSRPTGIPISGRVRSRLANANSRGRQLRNSPLFALKVGAAAGLVGMVLLIAYANRRAPTPVGLGELTRSTTVKQSAPFGSAEINATAARPVVPAPQQPIESQTTATKINAKPSPLTTAKPSSSETDDFYDEPEVVVRHHRTGQRKPVVNTAKDDGIKRFSDLD